jgi:hypothetical protein
MQRKTCHNRPSLRLDSDDDIKDVVEKMLNEGTATNVGEALKRLIRYGIKAQEDAQNIQSLGGTILKYQIHTLALCQRILGHLDEQLITCARSDAEEIYRKLNASLSMKND